MEPPRGSLTSDGLRRISPVGTAPHRTGLRHAALRGAGRHASLPRVFHIELRQFPHNACHFNLSEPQLRSLVLPWVREEWIEIGERKWNPNQAKLKIVEGPELPLDQLTMGRGWRHAEREGQDVTERVLEAVREQVEMAAQAAGTGQAAGQSAPQASAGDPALLADSLGLELLTLLDEGPVPLSRVWLLARARLPGQPASDCLALAERAIVSLLARRLVSLERIDAPGTGADGEGAGVLVDEQVETALQAVESWSSPGESGALLACRA